MFSLFDSKSYKPKPEEKKMSLTSFVKKENIRNKIDDWFPKPDFDIEAKIEAPPLTSNYRLVGTAFDYILRFWLERNYPNSARERWVAHHGMKILKKMSEEKKIAPKIADKAERALHQGEKRYKKYLETGELTDGLLQSALDLARLDGVFRAPRKAVEANPLKFGASNSSDTKDLKSLYRAIPKDKFLSASNVLLNPTFGPASFLVGGADADIILDRTLIDVKTTKYLRLSVKDWRQLVGYAVLSNLSRDDSFNTLMMPYMFPSEKEEIETHKIPDLERIGIYFSRHRRLWSISTSQIYDDPKYSDFEEWFVSRASGEFLGKPVRGYKSYESKGNEGYESDKRRRLRRNPVEYLRNASSLRKILESVQNKPVRRSKLSDILGVQRNTLAKYLGHLRATGLVKKNPSGRPKDALCKITEKGKKCLEKLGVESKNN